MEYLAAVASCLQTTYDHVPIFCACFFLHLRFFLRANLEPYFSFFLALKDDKLLNSLANDIQNSRCTTSALPSLTISTQAPVLHSARTFALLLTCIRSASLFFLFSFDMYGKLLDSAVGAGLCMLLTGFGGYGDARGAGSGN